MDREVLEQKLESLRRCLVRVKEKCPVDVQTLRRDVDTQDIITLNLTRAVQISVDLAAHVIAGRDIPAPNTMGQAFDALVSLGLISVALASRMKNAVGFRNIAIHKSSRLPPRSQGHRARIAGLGIARTSSTSQRRPACA